MARGKVNYLNNKDMLKEIHKSKMSYCEMDDVKYEKASYIINNLGTLSLDDIEEGDDKTATVENLTEQQLLELFLSDEVQREAKENLASQRQQEAFQAAIAADPDTKPKLAQFAIDPDTIDPDDLVFRVLTYKHIPSMNERKKTHKTVADWHIKLNFTPFKHYIIRDRKLVQVGLSHHKNGEFSLTCGSITNELAKMFLLLVRRYSERSNWRGYCVDEDTEALTQRGWLKYDEITTEDIILSFDRGQLKWSSIESIFEDDYDGKMFKLNSKGIDALITPGHKLVTEHGFTRVDYLLESDQVIIMGDAVQNETKTYSNELVELMGWIITEGNFQPKKNLVSIYQNEGSYADRIRHCLDTLGFRYSESDKTNICFLINVKDSKYLMDLLPNKNLTMDIIVNLTTDQAKMLIETIVDGDGWRRGKNKNLNSYCQKDKHHVDLYQALCAIAGQKTNATLVEGHLSFGKGVSFYNIHTFSHKTTRGECIDMHGGKNNGKADGVLGKGKIHHPNTPTKDYNGKVWCPKTEYGCFVARRNGKVYLTGNTYIDEMKGQALLQLSHMGLQFEESRSQNPFAYFTAVLTNSFTRVLNSEKQNQNLRDNLLEAYGQNPSFSRQLQYEDEARKSREDAENY